MPLREQQIGVEGAHLRCGLHQPERAREVVVHEERQLGGADQDVRRATGVLLRERDVRARVGDVLLAAVGAARVPGDADAGAIRISRPIRVVELNGSREHRLDPIDLLGGRAATADLLPREGALEPLVVGLRDARRRQLGIPRHRQLDRELLGHLAERAASAASWRRPGSRW